MKKWNSKKFVYIGAVIGLALLLGMGISLLIDSRIFVPEPTVTAVADNSYAETLHVITDQDYLPYSFYDEAGNLSGHDIEIAILLANEMKMNVDIQTSTWNDAIQAFTDGRVDVLLTCDYFDRYEGLENSLFTEPVQLEEFVVYSKTKIKSIDELYAKKIAVMENANVLPYIDMLGLVDNCNVYAGNKDAIISVERGESDCAVMRYAIGEAIISELGYRDIEGSISLGKSYVCFGIANGNAELRDRMNAAIEVLKERGELDRLHDKWLTSFVHKYTFTEILSQNKWILVVLAAFLFLSVFSYFASERRKTEEESEKSARLMALEDNFESLYDVDLETGKYELYNKGESFGDIISRLVDNNNFFEDTEKNIGAIYYKDRTTVLNILDKENIRRMLENEASFDSFYRILVDDKPVWARMRILYKDETRRNVIVGVFNAEKEMTEKINAAQLRKEQIAKMTGGVSAYIVNPKTEKFSILSQDKHLSENYPEDEDFTTSITRYIENDVFEPDRQKARIGLSLTNMIAHLENEAEYTFRFRDITSGSPRWYELRAVRLSDEEILYGFTDRNAQTINRMIFNKLEEDFFAMFYVNIDSETVEVIKDVPGQVAPRGTILDYSAFMDTMENNTEEEIKDFFDRNRDISSVKMRFANEGKSAFVFKSQLGDGNRWGMITELVLARHEDGVPSLLVIAFSLLDEEAGEKEQLKLELQHARDAAEAANESKTNFLFNMSHDIRTPMNAITGFTTMAKKYIDDKDRVFEYLNKIDTSGEQLLSLINQVLEMARIESGKVEIAENNVNVSDEFKALTTVFEEQAKVNGLEFNSELLGIVHNNILADKARMSSITLNITGNAMKYTPKGGRIDFTFKEIEARKEGYATYVLTVEDNGIGMSKKYLNQLFEPFSREKSSTVSKIQGTGLGMSIVKDLVDLMGGSIEVWSESGVGTRFDVTIDFKIDKKKKNAAEAVSKEFAISLEGRRVLLVEDNELNREIAVDILSEEGIVVESAEDGTYAVEMMQEKGPEYYDFILMDIQMPIMGGFEATRRIREMYPDMKAPIIALSANAFSEDREASVAAGMDEHVAKPIRIKELFAVLSKYL